MTGQTGPNIGATMIRLHAAITRSLEMTKLKCLEFSRPSGKPEPSTRDSFILYVSTMGMVIDAHHTSEDDIIFPRLRITLNQAPFDELSEEHRIIDGVLANLRRTVKMPEEDFFTSLLDTVTRLLELWTPHIAKEKRYLYSPEITAAFMNPEEHAQLLQDSSTHALAQGNPALMLPFVLGNLNPEDRMAFSSILPPEMTQSLMPTEWKPQWEPMLPFLLE